MQPAENSPVNDPIIDLWSPDIPAQPPQGSGDKPVHEPPRRTQGEVPAAAASEGPPATESGSRLPERITLLEAYRDLFPPALPMHACVQSIVEQLRTINQQPAGAVAEPAVFSGSLKTAFADAAKVFGELEQHSQVIARASEKSLECLTRLRKEESEIRRKLDEATAAVRAAWNASLEEMRRASAV